MKIDRAKYEKFYERLGLKEHPLGVFPLRNIRWRCFTVMKNRRRGSGPREGGASA